MRQFAVRPIPLALSALALVAVLSSTASASASARSSNAASSTSLISSSRCAANKAAGTITYISPYAYDASAGIIDVLAAQKLGYFQDLCLSVNFTTSYVPVELVSAGRGTLTGIGSAADTLPYLANKSHVVPIATYGDTSDYSLLTEPSTTKLTQLDGKTLGYKTTMPVVLTEMLQRAGVNFSKLKEVSVGYNPNILPEGQVQALQAYQTNEPLTLSEEHKAYKEWLPSSFGVKGTFNVEIVNATFLAKYPSATADFLRAELHGFAYCAAHAVACVDIEANAAHAAKQTYDVAHSLAEWKLESTLATQNTLAGKGVGVQSAAEWAPEFKAVLENKVVKALPPLSSFLNTKLAASLYSGKKLIWPGD